MAEKDTKAKVIADAEEWISEDGYAYKSSWDALKANGMIKRLLEQLKKRA